MKHGNFILKASTCIGIGLATVQPAIAETRPPDFICAGKNDQVPVFLTKDAKGAVERLQATSRENGSVRMSYEQVSSAEIAELCANGVSLATMPKPISSRSNSLNRQKVDVAAYVPSSFSIISSYYGGYTFVYGNFWVPGVMPASDNAHITQFDVSESGFYKATNGAHFVHMLTASSADTIDMDYHGKGMIFGPYGYYCGSGSAGGSSPGGGTYGSLSETYMYPTPTPPSSSYSNPNRTKIWGGADVSRDSFGTNDPPYYSCFQQSEGAPVTYLAGANRSQGSVYYTRPSSSTSWSTTPVIDSNSSYYRTGYAGTVFIVASGGPSGVWSLQFTNVASATQP